MFSNLKSYMTFTLIYLKKWRSKKSKIFANLHDKDEYVIHIRNLKQGLNHELVLKNVYKGIKFNQNTCLKSYIDMNTDLRKKKQKMILEKTFSNWWITQFLESLWKIREDL